MSHLMAEKIVDTLTIPDVLDKYGIDRGRKQRIPCPIHGGSKPNFCYTDKVFHCWTCGAKGNVIGLVMELFNLPFPQALAKINYDFSLGLGERPTYAMRRQMLENKKIEKAYKALIADLSDYYMMLADVHRNIYKMLVNGNLPDDIRAWTESLRQELEVWLDDNIEEVVQPWKI